MSTETLVIRSDGLRAEINPFGAELWRLQDAAGRDLLWDGDPAWWGGRAPLLFPIIGRLPDDRFLHAGKSYEMPKHGLARRRAFEVTGHNDSQAAFRLVADAETRAAYPFDFVLEAVFEAAGAELSMRVTVANTGDEPMPFSFGFHPAFRWPLPGAGAREAHELVFSDEESAAMRRLDGSGLLGPERLASPVARARLAPQDPLFEADAIILERTRNHSLVFRGGGGPSLEVSWTGCPHLGIWTKPRAPYLCIEPWSALPAQAQAPGPLSDMTDAMVLAPGARAAFGMSVRVTEAGAV